MLLARLAFALTLVGYISQAFGSDNSLEHSPYVHPGILHTRADLDRIKTQVAAGAEPWKSAYIQFSKSPFADANYKLRGPFENLIRDPQKNVGKSEMEADVNAAYQNAIMWVITGDESHARKSVEILNAWSYKLKSIGGHDAQLAAGLYGFLLVNAGEIIRYTYPDWKADDIAQFEKCLNTVFYPVIKDFATFANGNWDGACMKMMMATGVFCDDAAIFHRAVAYFYDGAGNGRITHYVIASGQSQESGRDQAHTQLGLGLLAECCQIGSNQGLDMFGASDNRLLAGYEYTAKYNLGEDVPFQVFTDTTGKYVHKAASPISRGKFRSVWEIAYNHYHNLKGLPMPYSERVLQKIRPEGPPFGADHPGFGTLLFTLLPSAK
jgi:hypothetical protein